MGSNLHRTEHNTRSFTSMLREMWKRKETFLKSEELFSKSGNDSKFSSFFLLKTKSDIVLYRDRRAQEREGYIPTRPDREGDLHLLHERESSGNLSSTKSAPATPIGERLQAGAASGASGTSGTGSATR
ncbi:F-box/SPRY domain-containing protein 1 [Frankliniella fusca]|uniref:F-box/SPRY domain-containing protein 1 n=1 Tax=Frankliniella fusca TaxID=407009 RepID=A0AAE1HZ79_9NEOP|nr:F-box/SPRY domain-containing protein 1 [Frankliniella fusca]